MRIGGTVEFYLIVYRADKVRDALACEYKMTSVIPRVGEAIAVGVDEGRSSVEGVVAKVTHYLRDDLSQVEVFVRMSSRAFDKFVKDKQASTLWERLDFTASKRIMPKR